MPSENNPKDKDPLSPFGFGGQLVAVSVYLKLYDGRAVRLTADYWDGCGGRLVASLLREGGREAWRGGGKDT